MQTKSWEIKKNILPTCLTAFDFISSKQIATDNNIQIITTKCR